jgi:hypothetical protein
MAADDCENGSMQNVIAENDDKKFGHLVAALFQSFKRVKTCPASVADPTNRVSASKVTRPSPLITASERYSCKSDRINGKFNNIITTRKLLLQSIV